MPVPSTVSLSIVELVFGPAVSTGGVALIRSQHFLIAGILPEKFETALAQLEAEPPGVGLDPTYQYLSLEDAVARVAEAAKRVALANAPLHPAYLLQAADVFTLEPMLAGAPLALHQLAAIPTGLTFEGLEGPKGFLVHYGFMAFMCFGRMLAGSRDQPGQPSRRFMSQMAPLCFAAGVGLTGPAGAYVTTASLVDWLQLTLPSGSVALCRYSAVPDSREQNLRDRHGLRYGTADQKAALVGLLATLEPLAGRTSNLQRIFGPNALAAQVAAALQRLARIVHGSSSAVVTSVEDVEGLSTALSEPVRSLSTPGALVTTLADRIALVESVLLDGKARPAGSSSSGGTDRSAYSDQLTRALDTPAWRATEAALLAEMGAAAPRPLLLMEHLTNSSIIGARKLALGQRKGDSELTRLLSLSKPLAQAIDYLSSASEGDKDDVRYRAVADALVCDPFTRVPISHSCIFFYLEFPAAMAKRILRGAFNEIDWIELLHLVHRAKFPGVSAAEYSLGIFDPLVPPMLLPLLDRVSRLLGIPVTAPAPAPPNWATLGTIVTTVASNYSMINGQPTGFTESNNDKLRKFERAAWDEASMTFTRVHGTRNPAGEILVSLLEARSGAMAMLTELTTAMTQQAHTASQQPEMHRTLEAVAQYGSIEAMIQAFVQRKREAPSRSPSRDRGRSESPGRDRSASKPTSSRERTSSRDRASSKDRAPSRERERSRERGSSRDRDGSGRVGSRHEQNVKHAPDGETFWYVDPKGARISIVHEYKELEALTGKTRQQLCFPTLCSKMAHPEGRALNCGHAGMVGHEHATSVCHIRPTKNFYDEVQQLFRRPAAGSVTPSARKR